MASARLLGAERVIAIDCFPYRLDMARQHSGADITNYEETDVSKALKEMTGGRGPDACIDAVGMEAHHGSPPIQLYDRVKRRPGSRPNDRMPFARRSGVAPTAASCR